MSAPSRPRNGGMASALARAHVRPDERIVWEARPSLVGIVPILASMAIALASIGIASYFRVEQPGLILRGTPALVVAILGVLAETGRRFIQLRFTTFVITDERIYAITTFFETNARSIPLGRATQIMVRQSAAGRILGFWQARVSTYGAGERALVIPSIRDGEGLLREASAGLRRGANVSWLRRGD